MSAPVTVSSSAPEAASSSRQSGKVSWSKGTYQGPSQYAGRVMRDSPCVEPNAWGGECRSKHTTWTPRAASCHPAAAPMAPHPITATDCGAKSYSGEILAIGWPGVTGSPTLSSSSSTFPVTGDGISALTLSVCASIRVSPSATRSPFCLLQAPTVISSAPWSSGITTSRNSTVTRLFSLPPQGEGGRPDGRRSTLLISLPPQGEGGAPRSGRPDGGRAPHDQARETTSSRSSSQ